MRRDQLKIVLVILLSLAVAGIALFFFGFINAGLGITGCTGRMPFGWTVPLASFLVISAVAWLLLYEKPEREAKSPEKHSLPCPSCSRSIFQDWRLCPYCGYALEKAAGKSDGSEVL